MNILSVNQQGNCCSVRQLMRNVGRTGATWSRPKPSSSHAISPTLRTGTGVGPGSLECAVPIFGYVELPAVRAPSQRSVVKEPETSGNSRGVQLSKCDGLMHAGCLQMQIVCLRHRQCSSHCASCCVDFAARRT